MLLYQPYTTVKILPTYEQSELSSDLFQYRSRSNYHLRYTKHVILPSSITTIPDETFYDYDVLEDINLRNITQIGTKSFYGCKSLKTVQFSKDNDVTIGGFAFANCGLIDIEIPNTVKMIGESAFINNYVTDYWSLENNATSYREYLDYQEYINNHTGEEQKTPSIESVSINVSESGLVLGLNSFMVEDECEVDICYGNEQSVFIFTDKYEKTWQSSELTPEQLNRLTGIMHLQKTEGSTESSGPNGESGSTEAGETEDDSNENEEGIYTVTLVDTAFTIPEEGKIKVQNGKLWKDYLTAYEKDNEIKSREPLEGVYYNFDGWKGEEGEYINYNDTIQLSSDITIYTGYSITGDGLRNKKIKFSFYGYDKIIEVTIGTRLYDYDIPKPIRDGDELLGWSSDYPVKKMSDIFSKDTIIQEDLYEGDKSVKLLYPVYQSDVRDKHMITASETLNGESIYRLNKSNTDKIYNCGKMDEYMLNQTVFNKEDVKNAGAIKDKILKANKAKVAILPKCYIVDVDKLKKKGYYIIKTNLELDDYISALTYMNCRYFQYLQLVQTPYFKTEEELNNWDKKKDLVGYELTVSDFKLDNIPSFCEGFIYFVNRDKFKEYYNLCQRMESSLVNISKDIGLHKGMKVTDALWKINELCIKDYAYDNWVQIYDLNWFLQVTDENRNEKKKADYHGVCASYSKLAFALLGMYGYEAIPTAVGNGGQPTHSVNKVVLGGKTYYCDYTWTSEENPDLYMFLTTENMIFTGHIKPEPDDMGKIVTYGRKSTKLSTMKIKSVKNQKGKKIIVRFNKLINADGYEIQYGTSKKFKSAKKKSVSKTKITIKKLKKNKTYYIRIRPYKNVKLYSKSEGKYKYIKYYGSWSKVKNVKIKK